MNKLLEAPYDQAAPRPDADQANPPHRILVVEDDRDLRQINAMVLVHSGYAVDMAEDGAAAWEALQSNRYDLMITDNHMPRLTGIELLKELRSAGMGLPVIMATTTLPTEELAQNPWLGPVVTLAKPYAPDQLLDKVKDVLHGVFSKSNQPRVALQQDDTGVRPKTSYSHCAAQAHSFTKAALVAAVPTGDGEDVWTKKETKLNL